MKRKSKTYEFFKPKVRETTTDKCIIFDFDELQAHSVEDFENTTFNRCAVFNMDETITNRTRLYSLEIPDIESEENYIMWGIIRPGFFEFLDYCFKHFKVVAVWSAGEHDYVHSAIECVWGSKFSPHVIYTQRDCEEQCIECGYQPKEDGEEECPCGGELRIIKPLSKFWDHPKWGKFMTPENTVIIDDRKSVFIKCNPGNGIQIPKYEPHLSTEGVSNEDLSFMKLMDFFDTSAFKNCKDVRKIDMQIFTEEEVRKDD